MSQSPNQQQPMSYWLNSSSISGGNADYIEALYEAYLESPNNVDQDWRDYFDKLPKVD